MSLQGIIAPNLTPFNSDYSIAYDLYIKHAHQLFLDGCCAIAPFGTTGEALSLGIEERKEALAKLINSGISADNLLVGTGLTNYPDTLHLSRHAMDLGCHAVMILPPFYFKDVHDVGIYRYFEKLINDFRDIKIYLYHIPPIAKVGFSALCVKKLANDFPDNIIGLKDSSGDFNHTLQFLENCPNLSVFAGSENFLLSGLRHGTKGCITATANIGAFKICELYQKYKTVENDILNEDIRKYREMIQKRGIIASLKYIMADAQSDERWRILRPPLEGLKREAGESLLEELQEYYH